MCDADRLPRRRNAFTLIELMVVIVLILAVAAVGIGYVVFGQDSNHSTSAATAVTGAMLNGKQRARHDGVATGIRLLFGTNGLPATQCGQLVLVQQPEDYTLGFCTGYTGGNPLNNQLSFQNVDFLGGASYPGEIDQATVQAGDYFISPALTSPRRINQVSGTPPNVQTLTFDSPITSFTAGYQYNIVRGPRRIASEDVIQLPANIVVDNSLMPNQAVNPGYTLCQNLPQRTLVDANNPNGVPVSEIVFSSAGGLIGQGTTYDYVLLWVRDPSLPSPTSGAPLIVSVQVRTGLISVYPVAPWNPAQPIVPGVNDPYALAKDGRASGM
ncbi:MAG TPA: prepilin-type N-terminal cleavage/methylation domain-containing protein [Gemmataceae bacterium]|nr:prepilin-type N-terminal cleavage/methylation domain-containing protein [Gemmataceae bacterium]